MERVSKFESLIKFVGDEIRGEAHQNLTEATDSVLDDTTPLDYIIRLHRQVERLIEQSTELSSLLASLSPTAKMALSDSRVDRWVQNQFKTQTLNHEENESQHPTPTLINSDIILDDEGKERKFQIRELTTVQQNLVWAFFQISPDRTDYLYPSLNEVVMNAYKDQLMAEYDDRRADLFASYKRQLSGNSTNILNKIEKALSFPPSELPKNLRVFIGWLRDQAEYSSLDSFDLRGIVQRKLPFVDLVQGFRPRHNSSETGSVVSVAQPSLELDRIQKFINTVLEEEERRKESKDK